MFKTNMGSIDRGLRAAVGIVLIALFFLYPEASWRYWTLIGIVPLATSLAGWCPAYAPFGFSTCKAGKA